MDLRKVEIIAALEYVLNNPAGAANGAAPPLLIAGIIEKSAAPVREREGLPLFEGLLKGSMPKRGIVVFENGLPFLADLTGGQKTGTFLDQKENHALAASYAKDLQHSLCSISQELTPNFKVLDAFCYSGGFAINILRAVDAEIFAADSSGNAIDALKKNACLNGVADSLHILVENIFDLLSRLEKSKEQFDMIILDPPAFAKSRASLDAAIRGYKEINLKALKLLRANGILVTCSCSYALSDQQFKNIVEDAAMDAGKRLVQLDFRYQSSDHPILVGYGESQYLKCAYYKALKK
jgi:23S rRNA (cytosine1962-C5)-methyltransferase